MEDATGQTTPVTQSTDELLQLYARNVSALIRSYGLSEDKHLAQQVYRYGADFLGSVRKIPTLLSDEPADLLSLYQPTFFRLGQKKLSEVQLRKDISAKIDQIVIKGNAGAGKTIFLRRHAVLRMRQSECLCFLLELRYLNNNGMKLFDFIRDKVLSTGWITDYAFRHLLKLGKIEFLLDALDEVNIERRGALLDELAEIRDKHPQFRFIITTRYGDEYSAVPDATLYHILGFTKVQAIALIHSVEFDQDSKDRFARELDEGLYDRSPDLISSPLLCTILLLTYKRFVSIPEGLHQYYQQAYEVLFSRHDLHKVGGLKRGLRSGLNILEMQSILDYISAISYTAQSLEFSESDFLGLIKDALKVTGLQAKETDIKNDLIEALSLFVRDGFELRYNHRSFQEYFCAHYIVTAGDELATACLQAVRDRSETDAVLIMAHGLNPEKIDNIWLSKEVDKTALNLKALFEEGSHLKLLATAFGFISIDNLAVSFNVGGSDSSREFAALLRCIEDRSSVTFPSCPDYASFIAEGSAAVEMRNMLIFLLPDGEVGIVDTLKRKLFQIDYFPKRKRYIFKDFGGRMKSIESHPAWRRCAADLIELVERWKTALDTRQIARTTSTLEYFHRMASKGKPTGPTRTP